MTSLLGHISLVRVLQRARDECTEVSAMAALANEVLQGSGFGGSVTPLGHRPPMTIALVGHGPPTI